KNYLRCHRGVKNRLVRESDQNAHLQRVNCAFSPVFALRWLPRLGLPASLYLLHPCSRRLRF
ncbi:MAG: hypothetical protein KBG74_01610, partial [Pseudomonas sp.]|nr:hypothetical protein [Pseudomonas sp.]